MKSFLKKLAVPLLMLLVAVSCAETEPGLPFEERQQEAFDLWMAKYHPGITKLESGLYLEWISQNPSHRRLNEGYWMILNYTGRTIAGDIYTSRSADIAKQLGYFSYETHYVGEYSQFTTTFGDSDYSALYNTPIGELEALALMHEGDSVRLYIPPKLGYVYGFSGATGYVSGVAMTSSYPVILELGLQKVVPDPVIYDHEQTYLFARDSLGILSPADSTAYGLYMKKLVEVPDGDTITTDSTVSVYYVGRFIDGFVFDTNVDSVAKARGIYETIVSDENRGSSHFNPLTVTPSPNKSEGAKGFDQAILHMRKGEKSEVVMNSSLGYGSTGDTYEGYLVIPPYTPLIFEIYVESDETE